MYNLATPFNRGRYKIPWANAAKYFIMRMWDQTVRHLVSGVTGERRTAPVDTLKGGDTRRK